MTRKKGSHSLHVFATKGTVSDMEFIHNVPADIHGPGASKRHCGNFVMPSKGNSRTLSVVTSPSAGRCLFLQRRKKKGARST